MLNLSFNVKPLSSANEMRVAIPMWDKSTIFWWLLWERLTNALFFFYASQLAAKGTAGGVDKCATLDVTSKNLSLKPKDAHTSFNLVFNNIKT